MSRVYDNWERLVGAVLNREELRDLARCSSLTSGSDSSFRADRTELISTPVPFGPVENNATGGIATRATFLLARAFALYRRKKPRDPVEEFHVGHLKRFSIHELQIASDKFSNKNFIGRGVFGSVYKGRLADGSLVTVKRLEKQIQLRELQFLTQVEISSMTVHRNLLQLIGFCITKKERLLVYPYMANGSVASCLRDRPKSQPPLGWPIRKRIALGSARGLAYLHENCDPKIIHRDVKAANIHLDEDYEAVVGDFGIAKLMDSNDTHVTTTVRGTIGHIPPEYLSTGKISEKVDVYGYGVMLLELISGQRAFDLARLANDDYVMLLDWVKWLFSLNKLERLVDLDLRDNYIDEEVEQLIQVALLCTQSSPTERPKMSEVVRMLEGDGLAERWEEYQKEKMFRQEVNHMPQLYSDWIIAVEEQGHLGQFKRFSLQELQVASDNFSNKNIIGRGGFGKVYKGRLADGCLVAVKRLEERTQGRELQFQTQVEMASTTVHRNLLQLLGFCITETERLLVYPYMANGSVESCLRESLPPLDWPIRKQIALGSARGLAYLHDKCDPKIIHRDVKAANILLDENFEAVVGDFGIAKLMNRGDTLVTSEVCGTFGHIAPEVFSTGKISEKIDVYGYGVMLLEFTSGERAFDLIRLANYDQVMLLDWVKWLFSEKKLEMLVDADLKGNYTYEEVEQLIQIALLCTQSSPRKRPKMSEVVRMLRGDGLAERWERWEKQLHIDWINPDSTSG